jgi:hypothetical protein
MGGRVPSLALGTHGGGRLRSGLPGDARGEREEDETNMWDR